MPQRIIMPKTGMAMEEGTIVRWLKKEGDTVSKGQPIAEIETDKVTMELEAEVSGVLLKIVRGEGETVPVTETIAWVGEQGEKVDGVTAGPGPGQGRAAAASAIPAAPAASHAAAPPPVPVSSGGRGVPATPAARRLAAEKGMALAAIPGSGPYSAVRAGDVERAARFPGSPAALSGPGAAAPATLQTRADVTELIALMDRLNASGEVRIAMIDFILKAFCLALRANPLLGLKTEDCPLSLREIAQARQAREAGDQGGKLPVVELGGGSFSVVDLGDYGITGFTPPLIRSHAAVLGVGAAEESLRLIGGQVAERRTVALSLAHDLEPAGILPAAVFLRRIRMLLENPAVLLA